MIFSSLAYLGFFLIVLIGTRLLTNRGPQHWFLLACSIWFYASWNAWLVLLILASAVVDFYVAQRMAATEHPGSRRVWLLLSLASNLGLLGFFKYTNFLIDTCYQLQSALGLGWMPAPVRLDIVLPAGISFYTFQTLSYTVDVYRRRIEPIRDFRDFCLFISFFPQLVAGPIVRAVDFIPQLAQPARVLAPNVKTGLTIFISGLAKKVIFADSLGLFVDKIYANPTSYGSVPIVLATLAYAVQIYCDFSGYTDMAIGSATALGFWLPKNFNFPYFSPSITAFWQRWHISLSTWLRDYLYIPLGGNRRGIVRTYVNLIIVMLLGGLWHGAKWTFVLWGAYQGTLLAAHRAYAQHFGEPGSGSVWNRLRSTTGFRLVAIGATFYLTLIGWILFRAQNFQDLRHLLHAFVLFEGFTGGYGLYLKEVMPVVVLGGLFFVLHLLSYRLSSLGRQLADSSWPIWILCVSLALFGVLLLAPERSPEFIYFQF